MRFSRSNGRQDTAERLEDALARPSHLFPVWHVREPDLVFGGGRRAPDPKTGLRVYGPCGAEASNRVIRLGIIGTGETIDQAKAWIDRCRRSVANTNPDFDPYLAISFPG